MEAQSRAGVFDGGQHQGGEDIPISLIDTKKNILVEGGEFNFPEWVQNDTKTYTFTGTNYEVIEKLFDLIGEKWDEKVTHVKSGDIIICIRSAFDNDVRTYTGTITQILSAINESCGCKHVESGATMTNHDTGETMKMGNGGLVAPNGKKSNLTPAQYKLVRTPEFKKWFGDWEKDPKNASKVVDKNGEPLVVYHGTTKHFTVFDKNKVGSNFKEDTYGFYFTDDKSQASSYTFMTSSNVERIVLHVFLAIKNPLTKEEITSNPRFVLQQEEDEDYTAIDLYDTNRKLINELVKEKDGVIISVDGVSLFAVPNPTNIKLADGTNTTFDPNNPDIRYGKGGEVYLTKRDTAFSEEKDSRSVMAETIASYENLNLSGIGQPRIYLMKDDKVIGATFNNFNDLFDNPNADYTFDIAISKEEQGKGYSKMLINATIRDFVNNYPKSPLLYAGVVNRKLAKHLKEKHNFNCKNMLRDVRVNVGIIGEPRYIIKKQFYSACEMTRKQALEYIRTNPYAKFDNGGEAIFDETNPDIRKVNGGHVPELNSKGGYDYKGDDKDIAKTVGLLTLPKAIKGTNCSNCLFFLNDYCYHEAVQLPVTSRMCCGLWDSKTSIKAWVAGADNVVFKKLHPLDQYPLNERGGFDYSGDGLKRAQDADLITLPPNIVGTNCSFKNCKFTDENDFCTHPKILLPVTPRMSCSLWDNDEAMRSWKGEATEILYKDGEPVIDWKATKGMDKQVMVNGGRIAQGYIIAPYTKLAKILGEPNVKNEKEKIGWFMAIDARHIGAVWTEADKSVKTIMKEKYHKWFVWGANDESQRRLYDALGFQVKDVDPEKQKAKEKAIGMKRWVKKREHIQQLSNNIHNLRAKLSRDLDSKDEQTFLTALIVSTMDKTGERVGNIKSTCSGRFGVTCFTKDHVKVIGSKILLDYVGKAGVPHVKDFSNAKIAKAFKLAIKKSPKTVKGEPNDFIFVTSGGRKINDSDVNEYLNPYHITSKGIRGYFANRSIIKKLEAVDIPESDKERKKIFNRAVKETAGIVQHGASTLKKHYMIPELPDEYIQRGRIIDMKKLGYYQNAGQVEGEGTEKKYHYLEDITSPFVPVTSYFFNPNEAPKAVEDASMMIADKADTQDEVYEIWEKFPTKEVPFELLYPMQDDMNAQNIEELNEFIQKGNTPTRKPYVIEYEGKYYLNDGHHRVIALYLNDKPIVAHVYEIKNDYQQNITMKNAGSTENTSKYGIGQTVIYLPKLSGFDNQMPLIVDSISFSEGDDFTTKGYYYTFKNSNLRSAEKDLRTAGTGGSAELFLSNLVTMEDVLHDFSNDPEDVENATREMYKDVVGKALDVEWDNGWEEFKKAWATILEKAKGLGEIKSVKLNQKWKDEFAYAHEASESMGTGGVVSGDMIEHNRTKTIFKIVKISPEKRNITMKVVATGTPSMGLKVGDIQRTNAGLIGKTYSKVVRSDKKLSGSSMATGSKIGEKKFLSKDLSGRGERSSTLTESHIRKTWDLNETDDDDKTLEDFLDNSYDGDTWRNGTEYLENIGIGNSMGTGGGAGANISCVCFSEYLEQQHPQLHERVMNGNMETDSELRTEFNEVQQMYHGGKPSSYKHAGKISEGNWIKQTSDIKVNDGRAIPIVTDGGIPVAYVLKSKFVDAEANANLISASKAMYEALKMAQFQANEFWRMSEDLKGDPEKNKKLYDFAVTKLEAIRAGGLNALKKAEGK